MTNQDKLFGNRVLIVDDEKAILNEIIKILSPQDSSPELAELEQRLWGGLIETSTPSTYDLSTCSQGNEALDLIQQAINEKTPYAVAFIDVRMPPGPDGIWTAEQIRKIDPDIQIVIMTGFSDFDINEISLRIPPSDKLLYIQKPIHSQEFKQFARALTAKWRADYLLQEQTTKLIEANERLKEHDRLKSEFVMTVSHELRTPLTIFKNILSNALAGVMGKVPPKLKHNLEMADEAILRLSSIISDFLDISKMDVGKLKLNLEVFSAQKLIGNIVEMIQFVTDKKGIKLDLTMTKEVLNIHGDYEKLARVITNLIDNAIKYGAQENGLIRIEVNKNGRDRLEISVSDNGSGIPGDKKEQVFDRFVQVDRHTGPGKHGTGLGLAICRELIQMHSGRIWVEDSNFGGCKFRILLPIYDQQTLSQTEDQRHLCPVVN